MATRPNILIVMTDHEPEHLFRPGSPVQTPNADRLAREGVRFSRHYTCTTHCCPSRATFMSGLYPSGHGIWNNVLNAQALSVSLNEGVKLFSEDLAEAGYRMIYTGKWHVSGDEDPEDRGWEPRKPIAVKANARGVDWDMWRRSAAENPIEPTERERGCILRPGYGVKRLYATEPDGGEKGYEDEGDYGYAQEGMKAIEELKDSGEPWCVFVGLTGPHDPYNVPEKFVKMYDPDTIELPESFADEMADKPRVYQRMRRDRFGQLTEGEVREAMAHFYAYCTMLDAMFGELLDTLDATGQADNTVVVRTSDHGDYCGAHGLFCKGVPSFDEAYRIPLTIRWPAGVAEPGREVEEFVGLQDFAPTALELAGVETDRHIAGRSLVPFLKNDPPADWPQVRYTQLNGVELYYHQRIVQTKKWKYVFNGFDFDELYDMESDPNELTNLIDRPDLRPVVREMCRLYWQMAYREDDPMGIGYITTALMPYGPMLHEEEG